MRTVDEIKNKSRQDKLDLFIKVEPVIDDINLKIDTLSMRLDNMSCEDEQEFNYLTGKLKALEIILDIIEYKLKQDKENVDKKAKQEIDKLNKKLLNEGE